MTARPPQLRATPTAPPFERQGLHVMAKPIGPICNLDCEYCYYLHKEDLYPGTKSWRMPGETLERYIRQLIEAQPAGTPEITFAWQGGEPTLLGVPFFERVVALQREHAPRGVKIVNTLQTNGTLLDDGWIDLFREHNFLIGLSVDGPADLHDRYRYDKHGRGSFGDVLRGLKRLKAGGIEFNALVVVNRHNGDHGRRVYTYLRDNGVEFLQFIPIVERRGIGMHAEPLVQLEGDRSLVSGRLSLASDQRAVESPNTRYAIPNDKSPPSPDSALVSTRSVLPEQFGRFLIEVFDEWVRRDVGGVFVQIFDQALSAWMGMEPSLCVFRKQCGRALAIEHNGDLFSCDHFVEPEYRLGNIHELPIVEMANSDQQRAFGEAKESTLPRYCRECDVRFVCNGECPKNRFIETPDGESGLNYLCAGYKSFFRHIGPAMEMMAEELRAGRAAANVMARLRGQSPPRQATIGSARTAASGLRGGGARATARNSPRPTPPRANDFCPCGSGKKYKKCCGRE
ncbi:MAG: anaerobic sulfatase maturase [Planctomycetaceae bacterium]|nr:anaerobic sulfatase maturase [Planctomycetaceae bacterium]